MPIQGPQWTEFLICPICVSEFSRERGPVSLNCGHTICKGCLLELHRKQCPFDQSAITLDLDQLPLNWALLQLITSEEPKQPTEVPASIDECDHPQYLAAVSCIHQLALFLKPLSPVASSSASALAVGPSVLSLSMQRKLVTIVSCQVLEVSARLRALRACRSLGERAAVELLLRHQNPAQLSANLWAAVRARGCQFLGPAMQEDILRLVILALEEGDSLSRKVLVMFVVQRLESHFPQASKTSIGHVVQLLYRASCFKVTKRDDDSSLMQLKEEFRTYESLRREHDAQIVQIALEAGLRIAPDQWSSLLYGDVAHKSHMQSIIDKLQSPSSFGQCVQELIIALQKTSDPANLSSIRPHFQTLSDIDISADDVCDWLELSAALESAVCVVSTLIEFVQSQGGCRRQLPAADSTSTQHGRYKTSLCRDLRQRGCCPRGAGCTFAHSELELDRHRSKNRRARRCSAELHTDPVVSSQLPTAAARPQLLPSRDSVISAYTQQGTRTDVRYMSQQMLHHAPSAQLRLGSMLTPISAPPVHYTLDYHHAALPTVLNTAQHHLPQTYQHTRMPYGLCAPRPLMTDHLVLNPDEAADRLLQNDSRPPIAVTPTTIASKSLLALQQRRQEILLQLNGSHTADSAAFETKQTDTATDSAVASTYTHPYSMWTSSQPLFTAFNSSLTRPQNAGAGSMAVCSSGYRSSRVDYECDAASTSAGAAADDGDGILDPISRMAGAVTTPTKPVQVSALSAGTVPTETVFQPVAMPGQLLPTSMQIQNPFPYSQGGVALRCVGADNSTRHFNTIGHGMVDPPGVQTRRLNRDGQRPSDPLPQHTDGRVTAHTYRLHNELNGPDQQPLQLYADPYAEVTTPSYRGGDAVACGSVDNDLLRELCLIEHGIQEKASDNLPIVVGSGSGDSSEPAALE